MGIKNPVALYWKQRFVSEVLLKTSLSVLAVCPAAVLTPRRECNSGRDTAAPVHYIVCRVSWEPWYKCGRLAQVTARMTLLASVWAYLLMWYSGCLSSGNGKIFEDRQTDCPVTGWSKSCLVSSIGWLAVLTWGSPPVPAVDTQLPVQGQYKKLSGGHPDHAKPGLTYLFCNIRDIKCSNDKTVWNKFIFKRKEWNRCELAGAFRERFPPPLSVYILCRELYRKMGYMKLSISWQVVTFCA